MSQPKTTMTERYRVVQHYTFRGELAERTLFMSTRYEPCEQFCKTFSTEKPFHHLEIKKVWVRKSE